MYWVKNHVTDSDLDGFATISNRSGLPSCWHKCSQRLDMDTVLMTVAVISAVCHLPLLVQPGGPGVIKTRACSPQLHTIASGRGAKGAMVP
jgi:hypothetical protein